MDITFDSVAAIVTNQYTDLIRLECRHYVLDLNGPVRFEHPTFLHLAQKVAVASRHIFSLLVTPPTRVLDGWCSTIRLSGAPLGGTALWVLVLKWVLNR